MKALRFTAIFCIVVCLADAYIASPVRLAGGPPGVGRMVRRPGGPPRQMLKEGVERRRRSSRWSVQRRTGPPVAWHLPGGPVGPPSRWAATSNIEVGQTAYPTNRGGVVMEWREGSERQSHKVEEWL